ncbi:MAG: YheV family putative zinc ribbon protein [Gammaproteobacteria bacterium]|jgi:hypothetical protein|nr:YheV family putative zinc ribbon protein [Gammaproteobacteria bacterium]
MKKRFIAGIVCPKCGAADSVRLHIAEAGEVDHQVRDCVECGYQESLAQHLAARQELPTRVNQSKTAAAKETKPQVLKIH